MYVKAPGSLNEEMQGLLADELNVKQVRFVSDTRAFTTYRIKPQMRTLGPKYGKLLGKIGKHLAEADGNAVVDTLHAEGVYRFELEGTQVELAQSDMLIEPIQKEGCVAQTDGEFTVVLDAKLTDALIEEGYRRELTSKLQTMRKEAGFEVTDRIRVYMQAEPALVQAVNKGLEEMLSDVLAQELRLEDAPEGAYAKSWDINGLAAKLAVEKL